MIVCGLILFLLGLGLGVALLKTLGVVLLIVGLVALAASYAEGPLHGRRYW